jgi:late competence protein required for DNA uptake (superfamily II DNA/RNA helicase)
MNDLNLTENVIGTTQIQNIHSALLAIKDNQCQKCGTPAKGFVYRRKLPVYYCKKCLYEEFSLERRI